MTDVVEAKLLREPYGVEFGARDHRGRADTMKAGVGGDSGLRPHELLEAALATCMAITARMAADDLGIRADDVRVVVDLERNEEGTVFHYRLQLPANLTEEQIGALVAKVEKSPVRRTLSSDVRFERGAPVTAV